MAEVRGRGRVGDVLRIDLGNGFCGFGRILEEPLMAFYDLNLSNADVMAENIKFIIEHKIIFIIFVMNNAVKSKRWEIIGNENLDERLNSKPRFFKIDKISKKLFMYEDGKSIPASRSECVGLERAAVWEAAHVEDRLRDYFAGVPNKWVESLKLPEN